MSQQSNAAPNPNSSLIQFSGSECIPEVAPITISRIELAGDEGHSRTNRPPLARALLISASRMQCISTFGRVPNTPSPRIASKDLRFDEGIETNHRTELFGD